MPINAPELLDTAQAAAYLGVLRTLEDWRLHKRHGLRYVRVGTRIRYVRQHLDAWLAKRTVGAEAAVGK